MEQNKGGITLRACKNTLGRLKLQILFRLVFVCIGWIPLMTGFGAWRLYLVILGLFLLGAPEAILCFFPDFAAGVLSTQRAYDCIGYEGFFPQRKIDVLLADPKRDKKILATAIVLLVTLGFALNIRSLVRLWASFFHINRSLPHPKGNFKAFTARFLQGLGVVFAVCMLWFMIASLICNALIDVAGRSHRDPYRIRMPISQEEELLVMERVSTVLREENYFYYVNIPFNENGFDVYAQGKQSASYLAQISHANGTQEMWEIVLTLNEDRSSAWSDADAVVHPIHFDEETQTQTLYISGSDCNTIHYRDDSGTFVQVALEDAPQNYQIFAQYILLNSQSMETMIADPEHLAADAAEAFIHVCYETETSRITIGIKDSQYPYEVSVTNGDFSFETIAIRFDATHSFTLP